MKDSLLIGILISNEGYLLQKFELLFFSVSRLGTRSKESNKKARVMIIVKSMTRNESNNESKMCCQKLHFFSFLEFVHFTNSHLVFLSGPERLRSMLA